MIANVGTDFGASDNSAGKLLGIGLGNTDADRLLEHSTSDDGMVTVALDKVGDGLIFTLPGERDVESVVVWNYNKPSYTDMGIAKMDISVWTQQGGWKTVVADAKLQEADGSNDYDEPSVFTFKPLLAEKIRFENLTAFDAKSKHIGLSEVRFHGPLGPAACNFNPQDGSQAAYCEAMPLSWTAGRDAVAHDVYVGETEDTLELLGRVKGLPEVTVSGLSTNGSYMWRVDEVTKDGVIETGKLLSFTTRGSLIGHWPLDETTDDAAGVRNGTVVGDTAWEDGKVGKAFKCDGKANYVEIPALNLNTDSITMCAWIKADQQNHQIPGVIFSRSDSTVAGINLLGDHLRYHWNDSVKTWGWSSGFNTPADGMWVFIALTVQPDKGTLYFYKNGKLQSSENRIPHQKEEFDGPLWFGRDHVGARQFKGLIDDVRIFDFALSKSQIEQVIKGENLDLSGKDKFALVGADLVQPDQSLKPVSADEDEQVAQKKSTNLLPVAIIIAVILVIAVLSTLKKKK